MKRAITGLCCAATVAWATAAPAATTYVANLRPINYSGVTGLAELVLDGDLLTVNIGATGLTPDQPHPMHIHGLFTGITAGDPANSVRPSQTLSDSDGDGYVELAEGLPFYGPVVLNLGTVTTPTGVLEYEETFDLSDSTIFPEGYDREALFPLAFREIVLHGRQVFGRPGEGTDGEIDGTNGYKTLLPVATGVIRLPGDPDDPDEGEVPGDGEVIPTPAAAAMGLVLLGLSAMRRRTS